MASATATTTGFQRITPPPTLNLNRRNKTLSTTVSFHRSSSSSRQSWPTHLPLISVSLSGRNKLSRFPLVFCSNDETLVTDDESQSPQVEDTEDGTTDTDSSENDGAVIEEESPASILASLQSYKEALADNDESKISEIEIYLKSVEDEKLVVERQLATLSDELSSARDRVLRISADFDNFRKRTERERISLVANAQGEVVENLLPVLDNFERAKAAIKVENEKEEKINNSYQSIYKQFVEVLNALGVVPVETTGQPFDPLLHEAIMREESTEYDEGVVIQEFRKGFRIGERLLRPSMVKVSAGPGPETTETVTTSEPEAQTPEEVQSEASPAQDE